MRLLRSFASTAALAAAVAALGAAPAAWAASAAAKPSAAAAPASAATPSDSAQLPPVSELLKARMEKRHKPAKPPKLVDINHASAAELKKLPGVGDAEAQRIIAGRPYWSKAELVSKKVLPLGPYQSVRRHIVASQQGVAPPKRPAPAPRAAG